MTATQCQDHLSVVAECEASLLQIEALQVSLLKAVEHLREPRPRPVEHPVRLLSIEEAAHVLGISRTKVFELLKSGELKSRTIGSRRTIPVEAIDEFVTR